MFKRLCALTLLLLLSFNTAVFASEYWVFDESSTSVTEYVNGLNGVNSYTSDENSLYGSVNYAAINPSAVPQNTLYQSYNTAPQQVNNTSGASNKSEGSFAENHTFLTLIGAGVAIAGLATLEILLSDDDNDKSHHRTEKCRHSGHGHNGCTRCM